MATVIERTTKRITRSANYPWEFPAASFAVIPEVDVPAAIAIEREYRVVDPDDTVREMTAAEKLPLFPNEVRKKVHRLASAAKARGLAMYAQDEIDMLRTEYVLSLVEARPTASAYLQPWIDFDRALSAEYVVLRDAALAATTQAELDVISEDFSGVAAPTERASVADARRMD